MVFQTTRFSLDRKHKRAELKTGTEKRSKKRLGISYKIDTFLHRKRMSPRKFFPAQKCFQGRALSPKGRPLHPERSEGCNRDPRGVKTAREIKIKLVTMWRPLIGKNGVKK